MKSIINEIKKRSFSKETTYHALPVIVFEKEVLYYTNNPYIKPQKAPISVCFMTDHFEEWLEIDKKPIITNDKEIKRIIAHTKKYINQNSLKLKELVKSITQDVNLLEKLNKLNKANEEIYKLYSFFINESFETDDKELLKQLPKIRLELSNFATIIWDGLEKILQVISHDYHISRKNLDRMTTEEIINFINGQSYKKVENREIAIITVKNDITYIFGKKVRELEKLLNSNVQQGLQGRVASRGCTKGRVLKINVKDYKNLADRIGNRKNFILVTPMTRPDITPYIKRAKGIVTDEGGVTCHAAIISREFKIPCIVGTKTATLTFNEDDIIEVDANNNKVTRLN